MFTCRVQNSFSYFYTTFLESLKNRCRNCFLQTGHAERDVHVIISHETEDKEKLLLLLLTAAYGLLNVNTKWQAVSDNLSIDTGVNRWASIQQPFYMKLNWNLSNALKKIVDELLLCGNFDHVHAAIRDIEKRLTFEILCHGPGFLCNLVSI